MNTIPAPPPTPRRALLVLLGQQAAFCAGGVGIWIWTGRSAQALVAWDLASIAYGAGLALFLIAAVWSLLRLLPRLSDQLVGEQAKLIEILGGKLSWPMILLLAMGAGISEEFFFRAGLQTALADRVDPLLAIGLASVGFAVIHISKPLVTTMIFMISLVLGFAYYLSGDLVTVVLGHFIYDIWALRRLQTEYARLNGGPSRSVDRAGETAH